MPTYDYECRACGAKEEHFHPHGVRKTRCKACGRRKLRRLVSGGTGVINHGPGYFDVDTKPGEVVDGGDG